MVLRDYQEKAVEDVRKAWAAGYRRPCLVMPCGAGEKYGKEAAENVMKTAAAVKIIPAKSIYPEVKEKVDISDIAEIPGDEKTKELLIEAVRNAEPVTSLKSAANNHAREEISSITVSTFAN
ncbi:MAG: hypothetical protein NC078_10260 [Ruminococcus sp.]|nr:hypothetical protein [Ruminococcus sp.]